MGFANSPTIVKSGLIYCFDPGNPKSYPGSGDSVYELSKTPTSAAFGELVSSPTHSFNSGGYFDLDGTAEISILDNYKSYITNFTIDIWFKQVGSDSTNQWLMKLSDYSDISNIGVNLFFESGVGYVLGLVDEYNNPGPISSSVLLGKREGAGWNNIIVSCFSDGGDIVFSYCVNGTYQQEGVLEFFWYGFSPQSIDIGTNKILSGFFIVNDAPWIGQIGPIKLYNRVLNKEEMLQNFNAHRGRYGV